MIYNLDTSPFGITLKACEFITYRLLYLDYINIGIK